VPFGLSSCVDRRFGSSAHAHLGEQVADVVLHRLLGKEHLCRDLTVRQAISQQFQDLALLWAEPGQPGVLDRAGAQPVHDPGRQRRIEQGGAGAHLADRVDDVVALDLFQDVPSSTGDDRLEQRLVVVERCQHQARDRRMRRAQLATQLHAAAVGQAHVEHGNVGRHRVDAAERFLHRAGFADDLEVVLGLQHVAHPTTHDLVVVDKEDPQRHVRILPYGDGVRSGDGRSMDVPTLREVEHMAGPRQLRRLLDGVLTIGSDLDLHTVLDTIIEAAAELVDAQYGALGVLDESHTRLSDFITIGIDEAARDRIGHLPEGHGILGLLIVDPKPLRLPDLHEHPATFGFPENHPPMTSFLGVPIAVRGEVFGNLYLCDKRGGDVFTDVDQELVVGLASAAGIAIENARLHARVADLATLEDRERIARDLHDTVIQRMFAIGLGLQSTLRLVSDDAVARRIASAIDDLDTTVRDVRSAIFELHTARVPGRSVRQELIQLCVESERGLGFEPVIRFNGPIDSAVDDTVADELFAVTREALTNVAKHAHARSVEASIEVRHGWLSVRVVDDGVGYEPGATPGRGVENLRARAVRLGGTFEIGRAEPGGTDQLWHVPLSGPTAGAT
jgi:signal transduction histidine kinase